MPAPLKSYIDRVLNVLAEIDDLGADKKAIYKELAGDGYDRTVVAQVVGHIRKKAAKPGKFAEQSVLFDLYLTEYEGVGTRVATHAARETPDHDPITGEIADDETPMSNASEQPGGVDPERKDDAASSGETATVYPGGENANSVGKADASHASLRSGGAEAARLAHNQEVAGASPAPATISETDIPVSTEPDAALRPQTGGLKTLVDQSTAARTDVRDNSTDGGAPANPIDPAAATTPPADHSAARRPITEPAAPLAAVAADGDSVADPAAVTVAPNVVPMRRQWKHSDKPHHDCLKPDMCGGLSNLARCQPCKEAAAAGQVA